jgi:phenylalanyl-tRNA synthetase alpha chain
MSDKEDKPTQRGHIHPLSSLISQTNRLFFDMGFTFVEGPLVDSDAFNFDAINIPADHPARDMQDTFFMKDEPGMVLRSQMSGIQVHYMKQQLEKGIMPPYRIVYPGKVFRNEATDMTHEAEFFHIEWLVIEEGITLAHLRGTIVAFLSEIFKGPVDIRFRPSFFAFTEPSLEVDMRLTSADAPEKLRGKWIEIMGSGMVHPNVIRNAGLDPTKHQGFAFAVGLDRLAMLKWGIDDVRLMHSADLRFVNQF